MMKQLLNSALAKYPNLSVARRLTLARLCINYKIFIAEMSKFDIYPSIINYVIDFLCGRKQWVKIGNVFSEWSSVNGGVPQARALALILFLIINYLAADHDRRWKFADDTSVFEVCSKGENGNMRSLVNEINSWCLKNDMKFNHSKSKDMIVLFAKRSAKSGPNIC